MATSAKVVESAALSLPREDRTRLAVHLIESIEERPCVDPRQVERAWLAEANRRYQAYLRGEENEISPIKEFSGKSNLRIPPRLHGEIATRAAAEDKSINQWVSEALEHSLHERAG